MSDAAARAVLSWRYPSPYDFYNSTTENLQTQITHLIDPANQYFAITDRSGEIIGHCCYGKEAQVPGGDYQAVALDVGVGMRPDWTGKGYGAAVIGALLAYARERYQTRVFRASIALWNQRSQRACMRQGFYEIGRFRNPGGVEFMLLIQDAQPEPSQE
jgi:RimJ/RimL family protein N-acetyltransferase